MQIEENISLQPYNSFGIDVSAQYFATFSTTEELFDMFDFKKPALIIGGGSNILLTQNVQGLVAKNNMPGISIAKEDDQHVYVKSGAGEVWHDLVLYSINNNLGGIENLSLIPGSVGASPMQNIGAYGAEIKDVFHELEAWNIAEKRMVTFGKAACEFGYRESIFKKQYKGSFVITSVTLRLNKQPVFNTSYGAIQQQLDDMQAQQLSVKAISDAVIGIRQSKLPDPKVIGNAGSFFKNPTISGEQYELLKEQHPGMVAYPVGNQMKLAAGWLIEQCNWKGYRKGDAGCHAKQALVLVNYGKASGREIYNLSTEIVNSVNNKFGVVLEREVNII